MPHELRDDDKEAFLLNVTYSHSKLSLCLEAHSEKMTVVIKRQEWLQAMLKSEEALEAKQAAFQSSVGGTSVSVGDEAEELCAVAGRREGSSLARCGPCPGFENLLAMETFEAHRVVFRACQSTQEIRERTEEMSQSRKLHDALLASCRATVRTLRAAKAKEESDKKKEEEKRKKEEDKANKDKDAGKDKKGKRAVPSGEVFGGRATKKGSSHVILDSPCKDIEHHAIPKLLAASAGDKWQWRTVDLTMPFIVSHAPEEWVEAPAAAKELQVFAKAFDGSGLKVRAMCR